ncbi:MAG TPA: amidohydrolase [Candidatus Limnocylindrales bacterium]|nr:amidohydrolase [Candidatus Limnocylindrales bacterium]
MTAHVYGPCRAALEAAHPRLVELSHRIHANPELGYQEHQASDWLADALASAGFRVQRDAAGMATALVGSIGPGPLHVAICAEYDALPVIGHACGHNIICAAALGAGLALVPVADALGLKVTVMGAPAEEGGGGKIGFLQAGYFRDVHAALMVHPWPEDVAEPDLIAVQQLSVTYHGREAHASAFPWLGINAADAMVVAQTAIGLLRQQLQPGDRIHGIVTKGGEAANVIPALASADYMVRAATRARMEEVLQLVRNCFEAGALATGASLDLTLDVAYSDMRHDRELAALYRRHAESLGRVFGDGPTTPVSTDMGNVSYEVPAIHPFIGIETHGSVNHQAGFALACVQPSADRAIFDGALSMALTAIDMATHESIRDRLLAPAR